MANKSTGGYDDDIKIFNNLVFFQILLKAVVFGHNVSILSKN